MSTGARTLSAFLAFLFIPILGMAAPSITSLSPTSGGAGTSVTITGSGFGTSQGTNTVKFNGITATTITLWSATSIKAAVPTGATTGNVVVTVGGVASNGKPFTVTAPSITSLSPISAGAGTSVTITGSGFGTSQGTSSVTFNGTTATTFTLWSPTSIKVAVPTGATTGNVVATVGGMASAGKPFTVAAPSITSLSPTSGAVGTSVAITGTGFGTTQGSSTIKFNGTSAATITSWSVTSITASVPAGATTGNVVATVGGMASNGKSFTVKPTPSIASLSPAFGAVGISVTISGANFGTTQGTSTVKFNGVTATPSSWGASQIVVPVPSGASTGNIVVNTSGVNTNGINFTVLTISSISVTPANLSLPLNSIQQYTATAIYSDNSTQNLGANVTWSSSDATIAAINASGVATCPGQGQATIQAAFGAFTGSTSATVTGSTFFPVGSLITPRVYHTATLLANGKVLIVGGQDQNNNVIASSELYDPATGMFTATGSLAQARMSHTATLLPDGRVLIAGGTYSTPNGPQSLRSAELYDPATGAFDPNSTSRMNIDHYSHTATLLNNGKVLIAGGQYIIPNFGSGQSPAELYDPSAGTFTPTTGDLITPRSLHTATLLNDGTVLIVGGSNSYSIAGAEIYDPATDAFTSTGSLSIASNAHTATLLNNGKVLIAGGINFSPGTDSYLSRVELYDPATRSFVLNGSLTLARDFHSASLLNNGTVLIVGGGNITVNTGTAELFDPVSQTFTGAGSLTTPRWGHTATLLNDATVLVVGGFNLFDVAQAELYSPTPPVPHSLQITPATVNMVVGDTRQFTAVDNLGRPRLDATWTVSDTSLASITASGSATLTAIAPGTLSVTATVDSISAQAQVTVLASGVLAPGTAVWSIPPAPGFSPLQLLQAVPTDSGPDLYSTQLSNDGTQTIVQALTADGRQLWQTTLPVVNGNSVPDGSGGLLVTEHNTCLPGQTDPMTIVDLDAATGQPKWQLAAAGIQNGQNILYCYPDTIKAMEPQIAIRGDGAIFISAMTNNGLPPLTVNGINIAVPASTTTDSSGRQFADFSPMGPPIVNSDGYTYLEYEVRQIAYPPRITSAILYLMKIAPDNSSTSITLSSTTQDTNLLPGRIIPDGQGGVLATWTVAPSNPPSPTHPYQASHVVAGVPGAPYDLPFTPQSVTAGQYPSLVLGEGGTAFATNGIDPDNGPVVASFDLNAGVVNWTYQASPLNTVSIMAAGSDGGVSINDSQNGIVQLDSLGAATQIAGATQGTPDYSWGGNWYELSAQGISAVMLPLNTDPGSIWATPEGNASQNGAADALCECLLQTTDAPQPPAVQVSANFSTHAIVAMPLASVPGCPFCDLSSPVAPAKIGCTPPAGVGPTYLILIGDPHGAGLNFALAAQQNANDLQAQGNRVIGCRVSSVQNFSDALTGNGFIDGGVIYYGHSGPFNFHTPTAVFVFSILAPGEATGLDTNIGYYNVGQICDINQGCHIDQFLGPKVKVLLRGCRTRVAVSGIQDGSDPTGISQTSIAKLLARQLGRTVQGFYAGLYFSLKDANHATSSNYTGEPKTLPLSLPRYLIPEGPPGKKQKAVDVNP